MTKEAYDKKLNEMKSQEVTMENIFEGLIFRCSWWGMADYFEVVGKTAKTKKAIVTLTEESKEIEIFQGL